MLAKQNTDRKLPKISPLGNRVHCLGDKRRAGSDNLNRLICDIAALNERRCGLAMPTSEDRIAAVREEGRRRFRNRSSRVHREGSCGPSASDQILFFILSGDRP